VHQQTFPSTATSFSVTSQGSGLSSFFSAHMPPRAESTLVFDSFDLDLVVKVLAQTAFSKMLRHARALSPNVNKCSFDFPGPFFTSFIPLFYFFQGAKLTDRIVINSALYCTAVSLFCEIYPPVIRNYSVLNSLRGHKMDINIV
jgi:hypothetical protein